MPIPSSKSVKNKRAQMISSSSTSESLGGTIAGTAAVGRGLKVKKIMCERLHPKLKDS